MIIIKNYPRCQKENHYHQILYGICLDENCPSNLKTFCCFCQDEDHIEKHRCLTFKKFFAEFYSLYKSYQLQELYHYNSFVETLNLIELALLKAQAKDQFLIFISDLKEAWKQMKDPAYNQAEQFLTAVIEPNTLIPDVKTLTDLIASVQNEDRCRFNIKKPIILLNNLVPVQELAVDILNDLAGEINGEHLSTLQKKIQDLCHLIKKIIPRYAEEQQQ